MNDRTRTRLFWLACIPLRAAIAVGGVLLPSVDDAFSLLFGVYCLLTAAGFTANVVLWWTGHHKGSGGLGGRVWWARARVVHALLWLAAGVVFLVRGPGGWILVADVTVGTLAGALHHLCGVAL